MRGLPRPILEFPDDIECQEVKIVGRVVPLQRSSEWSAAITERTGPCVHELPRSAGRYVTIELILDTGAVPQLAIDRKDGVTVRLRNGRTIIRESCGPQPFSAIRYYCQLRPILPADVNQAR